MKFATTSKSGHSVIIDAPNYKAAQKEAERRFGKGVIVQLVGNATTNPIVANALSVSKNGAYDNYPMLKNFRNTVKTEMTMLIGNINYTIKAIKDDYAAELRGSSNDDEKKTMKECLDRTVAELEALRNKVAARKSNPMV